MTKNTCAVCAKEIGWLAGLKGDDGKWYHSTCYSKNLEKIKANTRLCIDCGYCTILDHVNAYGDNAWTTQTLRCQKFNMDVGEDEKGRQNKGREAMTCTSFMTKQEYKQKALKGQLTQ